MKRKTEIKKVFLLFLLCAGIHSTMLSAQNHPDGATRITISGKVVDLAGEPLPGATIVLDKFNKSGIANSEGKFTIRDVPENGSLSVFMLGFANANIKYSGNKLLIIQMKESVQTLDEAVVTGYSTQVKANVSGAVEQISGTQFNNRPVTNLSRGLQGLIPNLNITMYDGNPSRSPGFNVRGATSIGSGGAALVLVDGVEGDPNMINPNDIESISVLKDASSAAVYGSRGTYGVILITTKKFADRGKTIVSYSGNYIVNKRVITPELVTDGYTWANLFNRSHYAWYNAYPTSINSNFPFSQEYLSELKKRSENQSLPKIDINPANGRYVYYDSHDWLKDLYKDNNGATEQNISIAHSSEKSSIYFSGRYFDQDGIYRYNSDNYKTYNFRLKSSVTIRKWLEIADNLEYSSMEYKEPLYYGGYGFTSEISMGWSMRSFPVSPMLNPDGTITEMGARSIGDLYYGKNKAISKKDNIRNTVSFSADIVSGVLSLKGDYTFAKSFSKKRRYYSPVPYSNIPNAVIWLGDSKIFDHRSETNYNGVNIYTNLSLNKGGSYLKVLAGLNGEKSDYSYFEVSRDKLLYPDNPGFSLSDGNNYSTVDNISDWSTIGIFARLNYDYKSRYLVELNGRYDASSKFPTTQRWGFFPSVSGAWRVTEEPFWKVSKDVLSQLKLRFSWGSLGNGNIKPYSYMESMPVYRSTRIINGVYPTATNNPSVIPDGLTWEVATTTNFGLDISTLSNRLNITMDGYQRKTTDMFTVGPTLPDIFGAEVPKGNYADLVTKGWEATLEWKDSKKNRPFNYGIKFFMADNISEITRYYNPTKSLNDYYEGMIIGEIWGFVTEGLFKDQADIESHPSQSLFRSNNTAIMRPGDIKFKKLDNTRDYISTGSNTVDDPGDRKIIGNTSPRYTYGVNLNVDWKNLSLSMFIQGVGKRDWYPPSESYYFWGQYNRPYSPIPTQMLGNIYDEDPSAPNPDAYFPRYSGLTAQNAAGLLRQQQTRYLQNAAYCRLKNITLSYTIPENLIKSAGIDKVTLYITGQNLFTLSGLSAHAANIDPETIESINPDTGTSAFGGGNGYPITKSLTLGLNIKF